MMYCRAQISHWKAKREVQHKEFEIHIPDASAINRINELYCSSCKTAKYKLFS